MKLACLQVEEGIAGVFQKIRLVFDEQDGLACRLEAVEAFGDALAQLRADSGHRLVEQEQPCIHRRTASEGEQLLLAVGNLRGRLVGDLGEIEFFQQGIGFKQVIGIALLVEARREQCAAKLLARVLRQGEQQVVAHREFSDEAQVLERARHAEAADAVRRAACKFCVAERNGSGIGAQKSGDEVEERGFPRAVAAQQAGDGSGAQRKANRIQHLLSGKAEGEAFGGEDGGSMGGHSGVWRNVGEQEEQ